MHFRVFLWLINQTGLINTQIDNQFFRAADVVRQ
jgi:hypothetical protein